jgi:hypothetical protein
MKSQLAGEVVVRVKMTQAGHLQFVQRQISMASVFFRGIESTPRVLDGSPPAREQELSTTARLIQGHESKEVRSKFEG